MAIECTNFYHYGKKFYLFYLCCTGYAVMYSCVYYADTDHNLSIQLLYTFCKDLTFRVHQTDYIRAIYKFFCTSVKSFKSHSNTLSTQIVDENESQNYHIYEQQCTCTMYILINVCLMILTFIRLSVIFFKFLRQECHINKKI